MKQVSIIQAAMVAGLSLFLPGVQAFLPGCQTCTMRQRSGDVMMRSGYEDARTDRRASVTQVCHTTGALWADSSTNPPCIRSQPRCLLSCS